MEGLHFTTQESISLELNRIRSDVETLKQNFGNVYQANIAYDVTGCLAKIARFYQQNGNLEKAELFTKLTSVFCNLAKKAVPYVKAIGTAIDYNSTNFQHQFDQFNYDPIGTTAKMIQHFYNAFVESNKNNDRMWRDEQYTKQQLNLLFNKIKDFANLPGPQKLEKATEFTLELFSQVALLGPTGLPASEIAALSEASQMMYGALKTECVNAFQLASKTGLPPESFAGLANVIREFSETLVVAMGCDKEVAKRVFDIISKDPALIKKEGSVAKAFEKVANVEKDLAQMYRKVMLGKDSTGRMAPKNLNEQLAMKEVLSNPLSGAIELKEITMTDPRWLAQDGWVKMAKHVNNVEVHFLYNTKTGLFDDFKFI